jgi:FkbM family methyltransferase
MLSQVRLNPFPRLIPEPLQIRPVWYTLESGIKACLDSKVTLQLFLELFAQQSYAAALEAAAPCRRIVDLGANRGLFMLFAFHYLRAHGREDPQCVCIEPALENLRRARSHVAVNGLTSKVALIQGAVTGSRRGVVDFDYHPRAHQCAQIVSGKKWRDRKVPVVDLGQAVTFSQIDLLKMDVEGSEQRILQEYPDILAKTRVLVAEFHLDAVDHHLCRDILARNGLLFQRRTAQCKNKFCTEVYARR